MDEVGAKLNDKLFAKLLFDCMFPAELAQSIREQGFDVAEARQFPIEIQQNDYALMEKAVQERRVLITCNYHDRRSNFCLIHNAWLRAEKIHYGVILVPQFRLSSHYERWAIRRRLLNLLNAHSWDELQNQLFWLP